MTETPILEVRDLVKHYPVKAASPFDRRRLVVRAVDGVSLTIGKGRTLGLVGESGCGKSTLGKTIVRLEKATSGSVVYEGEDFLKAGGGHLRALRRDLQIIFQDPYASLNPRMSVEQILEEPFDIHGTLSGEPRRKRVRELLEAVGLPASHATRYPHEFSGGQRQRIGIARAIALNPKLIVCDEPVSALDVSIQSQVLNLLKRLQREMGLSYLFIAHGLAAVKHISDDIGVMYLGKLVEKAPKSRLFAAPAHPYTQALISAIPIPDPTRRSQRIVLEGDVPSPIRPPSGCRFHTRCPKASSLGTLCSRVEPRTLTLAPGHEVACHLYDPAVAPAAAEPAHV
ncbi:oligopeptide transport system ATP-binding protein [Devosia enhydra]|uniref:Oligopeptide transport system ATP-binding protein n=1 Tax=Devosia enhydra TaxID=665118 RepID=A0A1K2HS62_9HYPH|nr:dipeptide ABC transporter ATP-binding protein [Devosia enhydra]SFZ80584.1 oligopeptide transport system ATP-binding protein [Devosia enhydra]